MTGRPYPPYEAFLDDLGAIRSGSWDRPTPVEELPIRTDATYTDPELYHAARFEESVFHRSMVQRYSENVPWSETPLYRGALSRIEDGSPGQWRLARNREELEATTTYVDELYDRLRRDGYRDPATIGRQRHWRFLEVLDQQIKIDIGRDGRPRFVDGRHRLSIAKLLGFETIPVVVLVRHRQWIACRERLWESGIEDHLDLQARSRRLDLVAEWIRKASGRVSRTGDPR